MTSAQVVETSVNVISNSPSQDYTHPDDRTLLYDMTPGFKPFTILRNYVCEQLKAEISEEEFTFLDMKMYKSKFYPCRAKILQTD